MNKPKGLKEHLVKISYPMTHICRRVKLGKAWVLAVSASKPVSKTKIRTKDIIYIKPVGDVIHVMHVVHAHTSLGVASNSKSKVSEACPLLTDIGQGILVNRKRRLKTSD